MNRGGSCSSWGACNKLTVCVLLQFDADFEARVADAAGRGCVLRYIATVDVASGTCQIGLKVCGNPPCKSCRGQFCTHPGVAQYAFQTHNPV